MKMPKLLLRWATLACWFLPFVFYMTNCVGNDYRTAFSKKEAYKNIADENKLTLESMQSEFDAIRFSGKEQQQAGIDTIKPKIVQKLLEAWPERKNRDGGGFWEKTLSAIILPNNYCLSGIGTILEFKNLTGQFLHGACFLVSLVILCFWKIIRRKKGTRLFTGLQFLLAISVLVNGLVLNVDFLFGFWIYLSLAVVQVILEFFNREPVTFSSH